MTATPTCVAVGTDGWFLFSINVVNSGGNTTFTPFFGLSDAQNSRTSTSSATDGVFIWGADLRPTNQGVNLPDYQRVNTSTDYDSVGFPVYIKPNGSNQFMQTNSINFTATDKMTVWQGVRKLSDAAAAVLMELSSVSTTSNGSFAVLAPGNPTTNLYTWRAGGTARGDVNATSIFTAPTTNVLTGISDISGDALTLRINGVQVATSSVDQGTGNYGNYPAFFYARAGNSFGFNGNDYGSIARGAASTAAQIANGEKYIATKTAVTLLVETFDFITTDAGDQIVTDAGDSVISDTYFA
jgi:hypothetical protein